MKVLNFLEMFKQTMNDPDIERDGHIETNEYLLSIFNIDSELYSQPFKPELITELFEILFDEPINDELEYQLTISDFNGNTIDFSWGEGESYNINDFTLPIPRTLDDFINDCQRTGIELEWKKNLSEEPKE